jgi:hypothetical protein
VLGDRFSGEGAGDSPTLIHSRHGWVTKIHFALAAIAPKFPPSETRHGERCGGDPSFLPLLSPSG